jgi:hypothetical protein
LIANERGKVHIVLAASGVLGEAHDDAACGDDGLPIEDERNLPGALRLSMRAQAKPSAVP